MSLCHWGFSLGLAPAHLCFYFCLGTLNMYYEVIKAQVYLQGCIYVCLSCYVYMFSGWLWHPFPGGWVYKCFDLARGVVSAVCGQLLCQYICVLRVICTSLHSVRHSLPVEHFQWVYLFTQFTAQLETELFRPPKFQNSPKLNLN